MIGTKFYKDNYDLDEYSAAADWCNNNNATIEDKGEYYEVVAIPEPSLEEVKANKIAELKSIRDEREVEDIEVDGKLFDYDDKARERINAAIVALELTQGSIYWTLADNRDVVVSAQDLKYVIGAVAERSNILHIRYRMLKEQVNEAQTKEEVEAITWSDE